MINLCPFCGHWNKPLTEGISSCDNCRRVFDTSPYNHLLSASWACRKYHCSDAVNLRDQFMLTDEDVNLLQEFVIDKSFCHDEFLQLLKTVKP